MSIFFYRVQGSQLLFRIDRTVEKIMRTTPLTQLQEVLEAVFGLTFTKIT